MSNIASKIGSAIVSNIASRATNSIGNKVMAEKTTIHLEQYTPNAKAIVSAAQAFADEKGHSTVDPLHLLIKLLEQKEILVVLQKMNVAADDLAIATNAALDRLPKSNGDLAYLSSAMLDLLATAEKEANGRDRIIGLENILNALACQVRAPIGTILQQYGLVPGSFRAFETELKQTTLQSLNTISHPSFTRDLVALARNNEFGVALGRDTEIRRLLQVLSRSTKNNPLLVGEPGTGKTAIIRAIAQRLAQNEVPQNLAKMAFVELDLNALTSGTRSRAEVEERVKQVVESFHHEDKQFILLIEGVENLLGQNPASNLIDLFKMLLAREEVQIFGTTTPEGLRKINEKDPSLARRFTILNVEAPNADGAIEMLRAVASRFEKHHQVVIGDAAIRAAVSLAKRYVQDKSLPDSAIDLLDEASARKRVEMTGIPADLDRDIQRLSSLKTQQAKLSNENDPTGIRSLEKINAEIRDLEPHVIELRTKLERRRNAVSTRDLLREEYHDSQKEMVEATATGNYARVGELEHAILPALKEKLDRVEVYFDKTEVENANNIVGENDVANVVAETTGIPVAKMFQDEATKLMKMEECLSEKVVGQDEAVRVLSKAVRRSRVGLKDPRKPIGSFLFLGASGVGKTQLAKALAGFLFDDEQAMTRFDMSEYGASHAVATMLGSPPGYQSSESGGILTNAIKNHPYSVLLFDEVEKAHPDIFNILLSLLDDGRITDSKGMTVDASNTVIVMTSNIGSKRILDADPIVFENAEGREAMKEMLLGDVANFLRPEFINRIDDIIVFRPLDKKDLRGIIDIELRKVEQLVANRELKLDLTEKAKMTLIEIGFEPKFGARPLKRAILRNVQDHLAEAILTNGYEQGQTIRVDVNENEKFIFV